MNLEKIIKYLDLGDIIAPVNEVKGGLLHKMYCAMTDQGKFAVKLLNSEIMKRQAALQNYFNSEKIAEALSNDVPVVASLSINNEQIHFFDGEYYMVFPWVDGQSIYPPEIEEKHCEKIGEVLGKIHSSGICVDGIVNEEDDVTIYDWEHYLQMATEQNLQDEYWFQQYKKSIEDIIKWNRAVKDAQAILEQNMVLSHRDLDPKNVMWDGEKVYIIDWESAGYVNPYQEMLEVINYWACDECGNINNNLFEAMIKPYKQHMNLDNVNWDKVFDGSYMGMLGWLEYNVKRALGMEVTCAEDVQAGEEQVVQTLKELYAYQHKIELIRRWL